MVRHAVRGHGRQVDFVCNVQITGRGRGHPTLTHLKDYRRIGASIFEPTLNSLPLAVSGAPYALETALARALVKVRSDFSLS